MSKQIAVVALATLVLAACGSPPQRKVETRSTPAPIEDHARWGSSQELKQGAGSR